MTLSQGPYEWSSAHRPIEFTFAYQTQTVATVSNNGGYAKVTLATPFDTTPVVGDRLILTQTTSGAYNGTFKITTVHSSIQFTIDKAYTIPGIAAGYCKYLRIPEFQLYAGYDTGEGYDTDLPLTLVATFTPKNSPDNNVKIDVSGYLKTIFTVTPPDAAGGIDFTVWNRYRLYFDGTYTADYYVINAAIEQDDLNKYYVKTGRFLVASDKFTTGAPALRQYVQDCGLTLMYRIQGNAVMAYAFADGVTGAAEHDGDFDTDFD